MSMSWPAARVTPGWLEPTASTSLANREQPAIEHGEQRLSFQKNTVKGRMTLTVS